MPSDSIPVSSISPVIPFPEQPWLGEAAGPSENARFLAVVTPGLLGPAYFREIGEVIAAGAGGPPDLEALKDVMCRHGLTPAA